MSPKNGQHKNYEDTFKQAAVQFLSKNGQGIEGTAAELGIESSDLRTWQRRLRGKPSRSLSGMARLRAENEALRNQISNLQVQWDVLKTTLGVLSTTICTHETIKHLS